MRIHQEDIVDEELLDISEEECIYSGNSRKSLLDDDEINADEEAFMQGYSEEDDLYEEADNDVNVE